VDLRTDQRVNCGPGPQVWSAVYSLVGPQVRKSAGPHLIRALQHPQIRFLPVAQSATHTCTSLSTTVVDCRYAFRRDTKTVDLVLCELAAIYAKCTHDCQAAYSIATPNTIKTYATLNPLLTKTTTRRKRFISETFSINGARF